MHPTQHPTIKRKPHASRLTHQDAVSCTPDDILLAIRHLSAHASTRYVSIAALASQLGLTRAERSWLVIHLMHLDTAGRIALSPIERPQALSPEQADWHLRNAAGIPCHEVALMDTTAELPLPSAPPSRPMRGIDFARAAADGLQRLYLRNQRQRISHALSIAAAAAAPITKQRRALSSTSTPEAA